MPANSARMPKKAAPKKMPKTFDGKSTKKGGGGRFALVKEGAAKSLEKKGVSPKKAKERGAAIAAVMGREKYGKAEMEKMSVAGKKRAAAKKK